MWTVAILPRRFSAMRIRVCLPIPQQLNLAMQTIHVHLYARRLPDFCKVLTFAHQA